jgi:UDP-N-acetylmuramoylalanine--D-glutamate ligase
VVTNLYRDHLDRHVTMEQYAQTKAAVFARQTSGDILILNADDAWTVHFLSRHPAASVQLFSHRPLPPGQLGIWFADGALWQRSGKSARRVAIVPVPVQARGAHNLSNLMAAVLAARAVGVGWTVIQRRLRTLPDIPFRQEIVKRSSRLTIVNDTAATSPDGGIAAVARWGGPSCVLICGGTDRRLDYGPWADVVCRTIPAANLIFLAGTATVKMKGALGSFARGVRTYETLGDCAAAALTRAGQFVTATLLFSPAAKSFGTFADEFDRGRRFNELMAKSSKR